MIEKLISLVLFLGVNRGQSHGGRMKEGVLLITWVVVCIWLRGTIIGKMYISYK